ncbi:MULTISPECIES: ATPase, T2SS/T4P/T4SS family [unclassified Iodidimonas]|jgi:general secretion pathway protein E|uniref:GspE/PulE family protein n=1 Tax=unclassified Iodidimonas TaxID=2626145 RepID=UPI0024821B07|nr:MULTISPECIES: ATPase, T2SS/T4P/T4SS family [unclassified Iodidimonas]
MKTMETPLADRDERLAALLMDAGRIENSTVERARLIGQTTGDSLPLVLLKLGMMAERDLAMALARCHGLKLVEQDAFPAQAIPGLSLSTRFLREERVLPLALTDDRLDLAMADPGDDFVRQSLSMIADVPVVVHVGLPTEIEQAIDRLYGSVQATEDQLDRTHSAAEDEGFETDIERLRDLASEAPVVRLVSRMIEDAIDLRASDIHLEPYEQRLRLRYRVDGVLQDGETPPLRLKSAIVSRLKIMAKLNIAERRLPQDGRIKLAVRGSAIDLRVSTLPSLFGEGVVLRVLNQDQLSLEFGALGIGGKTLERLLEGLQRPNGIFLVTGPTGSGKTTTLYAALSRLNEAGTKIVTVEDPVEYQLDGVNQIQVKPAIGLTFANALRAILRQDPDIILIGEIRDLETARIAAQAALTGHLVLSTLHTNSAAASVTRLMDMGLESYLVTATLNGVVAQRLVRRLCDACKTPYAISPELYDKLGLKKLGAPLSATLYQPTGCDHCHQSGYRGRTSLVEILVIDDHLRRIILKDGDASEVQRAALEAGMITLYEDGMTKALAGETSVEEVLRTARDG